MADEKRKFPRVHRDCFVELYLGSRKTDSGGNGSGSIRTNSNNISLGGVSFWHNEAIAPGTRLKLLLSKLDVARDLVLDCEVRRSEQAQDGYDIAVEFVSITERKKEDLSDFLQDSE
jgi:c-di-GMP-binding flagellar brake protein YcgR